MLSSKTIGLIFSALLLAAGDAEARNRWLELDGRAVMAPRRFGQENPPAIAKISAACDGGICGGLAGGAISTLLGAAPECAQQDSADNMITVAKGLTDAGQTAALIAAAIEFRQAEKNVAPGFDTNPPTLRNSVFCQKAPVNAELNGLVQAQDPANDPNLFFDPLDKKQITKGERANTAPFGGAAAAAPVQNAAAGNNNGNGNDNANANTGNGNGNGNGNGDAAAGNDAAAPAAADCPAAATVTVTAAAAAATNVAAADAGNNNGNGNGNANGNANGNGGNNNNGSAAAAGGNGAAAAAGGKTAVTSTSTTKFGTCTNAGVQFAGGLNGRSAAEFTFLPANAADFGASGEALNPQIIFTRICDTFTNKCGGDAAQVTACKSFAAGIAGKDSATAEAWNSGIEALSF